MNYQSRRKPKRGSQREPCLTLLGQHQGVVGPRRYAMWQLTSSQGPQSLSSIGSSQTLAVIAQILQFATTVVATRVTVKQTLVDYQHVRRVWRKVANLHFNASWHFDWPITADPKGL